MTAKQFIVDKLTKLAQQFPDVQIKYAYNSTIETHVVEFTPEEAYYHNEALDNAWIPFSIEFDNIFLDESIAFVSSDSSLCIQQSENIWNEKSAVIEQLLMEQYSMNIQFALSGSLFNIGFPNGIINTEAINNNIAHFNFIDVVNTKIKSVTTIAVQSSTKELIPTPGNTQYAMAA